MFKNFVPTFVTQLKYMFFSFVTIGHNSLVIFLSLKYVTRIFLFGISPQSSYFFHCLSHVYPPELWILLFLHHFVNYTAFCIFFFQDDNFLKYFPRFSYRHDVFFICFGFHLFAITWCGFFLTISPALTAFEPHSFFCNSHFSSL